MENSVSAVPLRETLREQKKQAKNNKSTSDIPPQRTFEDFVLVLNESIPKRIVDPNLYEVKRTVIGNVCIDTLVTK
jgi:hypothetical protein